MTATISRPIISNWETSNIPNLKGKTALITGANSGLGYYTAKALAEKNAHVVIACRSLEKAIQTIKKLKGLNPEGICLLYTSPSPRDRSLSRMPSSA